MAASLLAEALVRWQHAAGPFWPYVCAAPFLATGDAETLARQACTKHARSAITRSGDGSGRRLVRPSRHVSAVADRLLSLTHLADSRGEDLLPIPSPSNGEGQGEGVVSGDSATILLVDLPAEPVLSAAPLLVERGWYVVPVVQRWIASPAVLPCRRLVERLVLGAWRARRPSSPRGAILVADGERMGPLGYPATVTGRAFDNRYRYQICRFPSTDFLKAHGVQRIRWLTSGAHPAERPVRPDLAPYLEDLLRAGLTVDVLAWQDPS